MFRLANLTLCLLFYLSVLQQPSAQTAPVDSLRRIIFNKESSPEQRKKARDEMFLIEREGRKSVYQERSQQSLLRDSKFWIDDLRTQQDSIVDQLIRLVSVDTLANILEKKEAILLLARSQNKKAYALLMDNIGHLSTTDDYNNTDFWFVKQELTGNWALFPEIIRLISTKKLSIADERIVTITLLLDKIVQDPPLLIALLNLYAQKQENEVFIENKKHIVQLLQDMH